MSIEKLTVHIFSDSFGESGEQMLRCALSQFDIEKYNIIRHSRISTVEALDRELKKIKDYPNVFILFTLVNVDVVKRMKEFCSENNIKYSDIFKSAAVCSPGSNWRRAKKAIGSLQGYG